MQRSEIETVPKKKGGKNILRFLMPPEWHLCNVVLKLNYNIFDLT